MQTIDEIRGARDRLRAASAEAAEEIEKLEAEIGSLAFDAGSGDRRADTRLEEIEAQLEHAKRRKARAEGAIAEADAREQQAVQEAERVRRAAMRTQLAELVRQRLALAEQLDDALATVTGVIAELEASRVPIADLASKLGGDPGIGSVLGGDLRLHVLGAVLRAIHGLRPDVPEAAPKFARSVTEQHHKLLGKYEESDHG